MSLFKTSKDTKEILSKLRRSTAIRPNLWARAALGYSLSLESDPPDSSSYDSEGSEFPENVFWGDDKDIFLALIRQKLRTPILPDKLGPLVKAHVERGVGNFYKEFQRLNRRGDELILQLLRQSTFTFSDSSTGPTSASISSTSGSLGVNLTIGVDHTTQEDVIHVLNNPGSTPHLAIMGRNGTGKTRTGLEFLRQLHNNAPSILPFLIFDYAKGDIAENIEFARDVNANIISVPKMTIPIAPLGMPVKDKFDIQIACRRFRDTISSVVRLGPIQKQRCLEIMKEVFETFDEDPPDLNDLKKIAEDAYTANEWKADSLLAAINELTEFPMFRPGSEGVKHDILNQSHIIDIHRLPEDLRKLSVFLMLDYLYAEIMNMPDAPLDKDGNRQMRLLIVIDEAHHYLPCKQPTLENMIREVRSKGVGLWLFSQSPDDFDQQRYNFAREMGLSLTYSCVLEKPKMLESLLGGKIDPKRLSQLATGVALTRLIGSDSPCEVQAWKPLDKNNFG